jgi:deazaflavin-dependent oxidoreductase (nitroreductase family)
MPYADRFPRFNKAMTRFNRVTTNRVTTLFAPWMPWFGILTHRGRKSGKAYQTPIMVFRSRDRWIIALTYGPDVQWLKNTMAAGEAELLTRGKTYRLASPHLYVDRSRRDMPAFVAFMLRLLGTADFVAFTDGDGSRGSAP